MNHFKKMESQSPILFCIRIWVIFEVCFFLISFVLGIIGLDEAIEGYYTKLAIGEGLAAVLSICLLILAGRGKTIFQSRKGFFPSLLVGMYAVVMIVIVFLSQIATNAENNFAPAADIAIFIVCMILVGITEEVFFRGIITDSLVKKYGTSRKGMLLAVTVSGLIFGASHLINLSTGTSVLSVLIQVLQTTALGMFIGAVYMRTHNIFAVIFIHSAMDFATLSASGVWSVGTVESYIGELSPINLVSVLVYLIPAFFIMRGKKVDEVLGVKSAVAEEKNI